MTYEVEEAIRECISLVRPGKFATIRAIEEYFALEPRFPCSICRESKPKQDFNLSRTRSTGVQGVCRDCSKTYARAYSNSQKRRKGASRG